MYKLENDSSKDGEEPLWQTSSGLLASSESLRGPKASSTATVSSASVRDNVNHVRPDIKKVARGEHMEQADFERFTRLLIEHHNYDSPKSNPFEQFSIERWAVMYRHISAH
jgi:hypothetical protein